MDKNNQYYGIIENLVRSHRKFGGYEEILDDIIDDVYSRSENVISTIDNQNVIEGYLQKVVATSIITVPKRLNFKPKNSRVSITPISIPEKSHAQHIQEKVISEETTLEETVSMTEEQEDFVSDDTVSEKLNQEDLNFEEAGTEETKLEEIAVEETDLNETDFHEDIQDETEEECIEEEPLTEDDIKVDTTLVDSMINSVETHDFELQTKSDIDNEELFVALENDNISVEEEEEEEETKPTFENIDLEIAPEDTLTLETEVEENEPEDISELSMTDKIIEAADLDTHFELEQSDGIIPEFEAAEIELPNNTEEELEDKEEISADSDFNNEEVAALEIDDNVSDGEEIQIIDNESEDYSENNIHEDIQNIELGEMEFSIAENIDDISLKLSEDNDNLYQEPIEADDSASEISLTDDNITISISNDDESISENTEPVNLYEDDNNESVTIDFATEGETQFEEDTISLISDEVEIDSFSENDDTELVETGIDEQNDFDIVEDDTSIELSLQEDNDVLLNEDDDFSQPLEDDESISLSEIGQKPESNVFNYSVFDYNPAPVEIQNTNVLYALENLAREKSELNILQIYDLKYNQKKTISEISTLLEIEQNDVAKALSEMATIV